MVFVGDYFALGLVFVLCMFYFDKKNISHYLSQSSRYFIASLFFTALTALTDLIALQLLELPHTPVWVNMAVNSLYYVINILATSSFALFLFTKILEHTYEDRCRIMTRRALAIIFALYMVLVILNLWTGWLFYIDAQGSYCRGPLNAAGYVVTVLQMILVVICAIRNRRNASSSIRSALIMTLPVVLFCIILQRIYPDIMLNSFVMSMMCLVLFLTFKGQRQGIHTLTKLNDRRRFFDEIKNCIDSRQNRQVFLINLKNFNVINEKYGHFFGDELLYQFAFSLERLFKPARTFHMNGTVFAVVLPLGDQITEEKNVGILLDFLESGIECMKRRIAINFAVGECILDSTERDVSAFYEKLELTVSTAYKHRLPFLRFSPELGKKMDRTRYLQERIKTISRETGFEVWFQPINCLRTGAFCSMEALARLREPDGTMISPGEFIPVAEQTGHISSLTWFVVEQVCDILKRNRELDNVSVSINISMPQLLEKGFLVRLNSIVNQAGIAHRRICLEFTERALPDNLEHSIDMIEQLSQEGYRCFLDDFGTGYSNFNFLLQMPFEIIKMDSCLLHSSLGQDRFLLSRTLTELFHKMNFAVVAEGVETMEEVLALKELGVDRVQGFALARPMPEDKLIPFYRQHPVTK